jgi:hypothetical protein
MLASQLPFCLRIYLPGISQISTDAVTTRAAIMADALSN